MPEIKKDPLYIYDPVTAEILKPVDLLRDIDQLPDDDLATLITDGEDLLNELSVAVNQLRATLQHRLEADQAVLRETPGFTVKLTAQREYVYNLPALLKLKEHLTPEQYAKAVPTPDPKPNKTELNKLVKLGGAIKQIIEAAVKPVDKPPKLEITRKVQVQANA